MKEKTQHIGSDFDEFLAEEGILAEVELAAAKRVIAFQVEQAMKQERLTKTAMAGRMKTSRAALGRLLDPENFSVTLETLGKAAQALGKHLHVELR